MQVGYTIDFRNPAGRDWRTHWEDNLYLMCEAEAMGFDYLLIQQHFFQEYGYGPSVPVFLTILAERTERIRIGSYLYVLPLSHAAQLAQETAVLDHVSGGRLDVTVGMGHSAEELKALGYNPRRRRGRMEEGLEVLKLAWTQRPFSFSGEHYELENLTVLPEPLQQPHPPLWVGATTPPAAARAGRHLANLHGANPSPDVYDAYFDAYRAAGGDPAAARVSQCWPVTVTDDDPEEVWRRNEMLYFNRHDYYRRIREEIGVPAYYRGDSENAPKAETPPRSTYRDYELIGSPEAVIESLTAAVEETPITDIVHLGHAGGIDPRTEAYESLKRFGEEVLPALKALEPKGFRSRVG